MRVGIYVYALATIATGVMNLVWGQFQAGYEPIQAFGDNVPGQRLLAYIFAAILVAAGLALLSARGTRAGAATLAATYCIFAIFWLPRLITAPHYLGFHLPVFVGVLDGVGQQLILAAAAAVIYIQGATSLARWIFGLSSLDFGLAHLDSVGTIAPMVPKWLPPGQDFWVLLTGCAFVLAGIAILTGLGDVLAARLLALMLLVFSALALVPMIAASPNDQGSWGSNAYNLTAVAAVWILASSLASERAPRTATKSHVSAT
jgi:uncharacterized membrane protein YphA (DoxX/SURF4 family)